MSDSFDHLNDAFDFDGGGNSLDRFRFHVDHLYYHMKIKILGIEHETQKAYLLRLSETEGVWVPKSICKNLSKSSVYVHKATYAKSDKVPLQKNNTPGEHDALHRIP